MDSSSRSGVSEDSGPDLIVRFRKIVNWKMRTSTQEAEMHRLDTKLFQVEVSVEISPPVKYAIRTPEPVVNPVPDPVFTVCCIQTLLPLR